MTPEELAKLAEEIEVGDPIEWGELLINEKEAYLEMAQQVIGIMQAYNPVDRQTVMLAAVVKLLVENFTLNVRLMQTEIND